MESLRTGDIITARVKSLPFLLHKGVVVSDDNSISIYHNTPMLKNAYGGNVVKEDITEWQASRYIISIEHTGLSKKFIEQFSYDLRYRPFNLFSFNCEQYISLLKNDWSESPQLFWWGLGIALYLKLKKDK